MITPEEARTIASTKAGRYVEGKMLEDDTHWAVATGGDTYDDKVHLIDKETGDYSVTSVWEVRETGRRFTEPDA